MEFNFSGKTFLVTGAANGIGLAVTEALVNAKADVHAVDKSQEGLDKLVQECGDKIHPHAVDLSDWEATKTALEHLPAVDGVCNNAGILGNSMDALSAEKADIAKILDINLYGALNVAQIAAKKMVAAGIKGSIVNTSSICSLRADKVDLGYALSKAALDMITKRFALELGPHNIRVNSVNPTVVRTDLALNFQKMFPAKVNMLLDHTPLGDFAEMREVVSPILYLLSDGSSKVTGTHHVIDGGCTICTGVYKGE